MVTRVGAMQVSLHVEFDSDIMSKHQHTIYSRSHRGANKTHTCKSEADNNTRASWRRVQSENSEWQLCHHVEILWSTKTLLYLLSSTHSVKQILFFNWSFVLTLCVTVHIVLNIYIKSVCFNRCLCNTIVLQSNANSFTFIICHTLCSNKSTTNPKILCVYVYSFKLYLNSAVQWEQFTFFCMDACCIHLQDCK